MKKFCLLLALSASFVPDWALAQSRPVEPAEPGAGQLLFEAEGEEPWLAPQVSTEVRMVVTGMIARTHVEQVFENPSEVPVEAVYVFPLPDTAAVDGLTLQVGERRIVGEIREREQAVREFENAASAGKKATLVSQERPNLFTTSVANIGAGELVTVSITYQEDVRYDHGEFSLSFPSTLTPRYNPGATGRDGDAALFGATRVRDAARISPPVLLDGTGPLLDVQVKLDAGVELQTLESPSHELEVTGGKPGPVGVRLKDGPVLADRDFRLRWRPTPSSLPRTAAFTEDFGGERYALLMLLPPTERAAAALARETTFVIDTSGSMSGASIEQAVSSLVAGLAALAPRDYFNVIEFNSAARALFDGARPATPENVALASRWVRALSADGGTEMLSALELALAERTASGRVEQLVFITDGSVGNEDEVFRFIRGRLGERRLFTVGIGSAPNRYFMRGAARFGRGSFTEVNALAEVSTQMNQLWTKLDAPVMRDVALDFGGAPVEVWPRRAPDLYAGEPLVVFAKLGAGVSRAKLTGALAQRDLELPVDLARTTSERGIHRLWARRKIDGLMDGLVEGRDEASIRAEVLPLALSHHLVSKYTSLVAIDPRVTADGRAPRADVASALPAGNRMFGNMPQTATPGPFCLLFGVLSFASAALLARGGGA